MYCTVVTFSWFRLFLVRNAIPAIPRANANSTTIRCQQCCNRIVAGGPDTTQSTASMLLDCLLQFYLSEALRQLLSAQRK